MKLFLRNEDWPPQSKTAPAPATDVTLLVFSRSMGSKIQIWSRSNSPLATFVISLKMEVDFSSANVLSGTKTSCIIWHRKHALILMFANILKRKVVILVEEAPCRNCETQPSSIHWLSSSIFPCSFVRSFVVRPASVTSPLISTIWCSRPYKPYIFC